MGEIPDLTTEEIAAHSGMHDTVNDLLLAVPAAKSAVDEQRERIKESLREAWNLCVSVEGMVKAKPPTPTAVEALAKPDRAGGFSLSRARRRASNLLATLDQFPGSFSVVDKSKAQMAEILRRPIEHEQEMARRRSRLKSVRAELRAAIRTLDQENERIVMILKATFPRGTVQREVIQRIPPRTLPPKGRKRKKNDEAKGDRPRVALP
jgi:hypothetical protein